MEIKATIQIDESSFAGSLEEIVTDYLDSHLEDELDSSIDKLIENRDFKSELSDEIKEQIESYLSYEYDLSSELTNIDLSSHVNVTGAVEELLDNYDASSPCSTGLSFATAVMETIKHHNMNKTLQPFSKFELSEMIKETTRMQVRNELSDLIKSIIKQEFTNGLFESIKKDYLMKLSIMASKELQQMNSQFSN